ncbi:MAG: hypothetical protein WCD37_15590 [Chloroflexia bacterium]
MISDMQAVWIFKGPKRFPGFPSAVFSDLALGAKWARANRASGVLTCYPLNIGVYEWAIANRLFKPKGEEQKQAEFIENFSSAGQEHYHFRQGSANTYGFTDDPRETSFPQSSKNPPAREMVWVFVGPRLMLSFPSATFTDISEGEQWIRNNALSGIFIRYPVDISAYDWAIEGGIFVPEGDEQKQPDFIESFSSTRQEHRCYYQGKLAAG